MKATGWEPGQQLPAVDGIESDHTIESFAMPLGKPVEWAAKLIRASWLGRVVGKGAVEEGQSFFIGTKYSSKVLGQIKNADFHAFPESVIAFEKSGVISTVKGGDGITRQMLKIPGQYGNKKGFFEFIKEADGSINHRLFRPTTGN